MCVYTQEVKDCLASFVDGEQAFSVWNVTQAVRSVVGRAVPVSHDEVKGMVHVLMEQNDDFCGQFNGKFVEYVPLVEAVEDDDVLDDDELLNEDKKAEGAAEQMLKALPKGATASFLDREHLVFRGETVTLRFDRLVSVVEIRAG